VIAGSAADTGKADDVVLKKFEEQQAEIQSAKQAQKRGPRVLGLPVWAVALIVALIAGVGGFIFLQQRTTDMPMAVVDLRWERTITVQQLTAVPGSGWQDEVPIGAYNRNCFPDQRAFTRTIREQTGMRRVDQGDGTFREVPVYSNRTVTEYRTDTRCNYLVNIWQTVDTLRTNGGPNDPPTWAAFTPRGTGAFIGDTRGSRAERYRVFFADMQDKGQRWDYTVPDEGTWRRFSVGQQYTVRINTFGEVFWDSLRPLG
jgi:hypothetical protein